ncbi:hypothetical protein [Moheibacter sediminis]|nr:hypothetical protein [Moheibacter sediminis]
MKYLLMILICGFFLNCSNKENQINKFEKIEVIYENKDFNFNLKNYVVKSYDSKLIDTIKINETDKLKLINAFFNNHLDTIKTDIEVTNNDGMAIIPDLSERNLKILNSDEEVSIYISGLAKINKVNSIGQNILKFDSIIISILNKYEKFNQFKIEIEKNDNRMWL